MFGRGGEEAECLSENGIPFEIIPGITSGIAATAYAGIPVTHRDAGSNVAFVTGHYKKKKILRKSGKCWLQELIHLSSIWVSKTYSRLKENSLKTAGTVLRRRPLFTGEQRTSKICFCTVETLSETVIKEDIKNPSLIVIGNVVNYHYKLDWFESELKKQDLSEAL